MSSFHAEKPIISPSRTDANSNLHYLSMATSILLCICLPFARVHCAVFVLYYLRMIAKYLL